MADSDEETAEHRPADLPPDGTIVTAKTMVDPLDALDGYAQSRTITGPLETRWVSLFEYLQVVVAGKVVELASVQELSKEERAGSKVRDMTALEIIDSRTVRDESGHDHDVLEAIETLPWVEQTCPVMPHDYAHWTKSDPLAYAVVERMLKPSNPETYRAYFRGYKSANRYWEAPDGRRYWLTRMMINRCWPESVEPLRRVDQGAKAILDWDGPPWAPNGSGKYERGKGRTWWPTQTALADGYKPCKACQRKGSEVSSGAAG